MENSKSINMTKKDLSTINVNPDKIKDIIANMSSSPTLKSDSSKSKTPNGLTAHSENISVSKKPKLDSSLQGKDELFDENSNSSSTSTSDKKDKETLVNGNGLSSFLRNLPSGVSLSMKPISSSPNENSPQRNQSLKSSKYDEDPTPTTKSIPSSTTIENSSRDSLDKPSNSPETISTKSPVAESGDEDSKKSAKVSSSEAAKTNLLETTPLLSSGSISLPTHNDKESRKSDPTSHDSSSNSRSLSPNPNQISASLAYENSSSQSSLANQTSLKNLSGSSDGAVFPSSASKSENENRLTFNNVLKDKSIDELGKDDTLASKCEKNVESVSEGDSKDQGDSFKLDVSEKKSDGFKGKISSDSPKRDVEDQSYLEKKKQETKKHSFKNAKTEKNTSEKNEEKIFKDDCSSDEKRLHCDKLSGEGAVDDCNKVEPTQTNTDSLPKICDSDSDGDMQFEELDIDQFDDADINESELLLDENFASKNMDTLLDEMDSDETVPIKKEDTQTASKKINEDAPSVQDETSKEKSNEKKISEELTSMSESQKGSDDETEIPKSEATAAQKEPDIPKSPEECHVAEGENKSILADEESIIASQEKGEDEAKLVSKEEKEDSSDAFALEDEKQSTPFDSENKDNISSSNKKDLASSQDVKLEQKSSALDEAKHNSKNKVAKDSQAAKTKDPLKDKYFLEALSSLECEDPLTSISKPKPLKPSQEIIAPMSPTESLTLLENINTSRSQQPPSKVNGPFESTLSTDGPIMPSNRSNSEPSDKSSSSTNKPESDSSDSLPRVASSKRSFDTISDSQSTSSDLKKFRVAKRKPGRPPKQTSDLKYQEAFVKETLEKTKKVEKALEESKSTSRHLEDPDDVPNRNSNFSHIDQEELERVTAIEKGRLQSRKGELKRIMRKDLETMVVQLFMDKLLYEHELGRQRDLCKRLEATLETNRKKAAQFHKEVDDLKKVTQRLQAEHLARKNQIVAPVRVKRSVGIQATPSIISKGLITASNQTGIKLLSPTKPTSKSGSEFICSSSSSSFSIGKAKKVTDYVAINQVCLPPTAPNSTTSSSSPASPSKSSTAPSFAKPSKSVGIQATKQNVSTAAVANSSTQLLMVNSPQLVVQQQQQQQPQNTNLASTIMPMSRVVRAPLSHVPSPTQQQAILLQPTTPKTPAVAATASKSVTSSAVIDLTDDDENAKNLKSGTSMVAIPRSATTITPNAPAGQFVTLPIKACAQQPTPLNQLFLVPTSGGQPTATLVVSSMANVTQTLSPAPLRTSTPGVLRNNSPQVGSSPTTLISVGGNRYASPSPNLVNATRLVMGTPINGAQNIISKSTHPAPLPRAPPQQTIGYNKRLPPKPVLKLSHKESSIVLSWNMIRNEEHEIIASYQLYAYQEGTAPPTSLLWKKVGSVKALDLPMACTLTQFMPGHIYHFAVRAVDIRNRLGQFSDPKSIRLGN